MTLGFMQGRLSPPVDGKIQAFPAAHWREEFPTAEKLGLWVMEWTLDHDKLSENPLMSDEGRREINRLCAAHHLTIPSLTGDCFMQAPFWKETKGSARAVLLAEFDAVAQACALLGVKVIVVPVVDHGRIENKAQAEILHGALCERADSLAGSGLRVAFECELPPSDLARWIELYPEPVFGVNYDTGNSAGLGYDAAEEWVAYGSRVINVHVKDRPRGGSTVPLGEGACDFAACFRAMRGAVYTGSLVLQTARSTDGEHALALARYRDFVIHQMQNA